MSTAPAMHAKPQRYAFGPFVLVPDERLLLRRGERVRLPPRAFDVLSHLITRAGHLVSREELFEVAWPGLVVEENALSVAVARLRSVLGPEGRALIETVPGRGYRLLGEVTELMEESSHEALRRQDGSGRLVSPPRTGANRGRTLARLTALASVVALASLSVVAVRRAPGAGGADGPHEPPPEALQAYQRGRALWESRSFDHPAMMAEFKHAADIDPLFAAAHVGQAQLYAMQHRAGDEADAALDRAFALDSSLAEAWATRGFVQAFQKWEWLGAERSFQRALALDPSDPTTHQWVAALRMVQRRFHEAEAHLTTALAAAPAHAGLHADLCEVRYYQRELEAATAACERALALDPSHTMAQRNMRYLREAAPDGRAVARAHLREHNRYVGDFYLRARLFATMGERDSALALAENVVEFRGFHAPFLNADPVFDPIRGDPRWQRAIAAMGL